MYFDIPQSAEALKVSPKTIRRLIARGELPAVRVGQRQIRIKQSDLEHLGTPILPTKRRGKSGR